MCHYSQGAPMLVICLPSVPNPTGDFSLKKNLHGDYATPMGELSCLVATKASKPHLHVFLIIPQLPAFVI